MNSQSNYPHQEYLSDAYLSDAQLAQRYHVSRATIWRWSSEGRIPKPVKLTPGCTRWRHSDMSKWEQETVK